MKISDTEIWNFVAESNAIERIFRIPYQYEIDEFKSFIYEPDITVERIEKFVSIYEPKAQLRDKPGMDVRVGKYYPPHGDPSIRGKLRNILEGNMDHHDMHIEYEKLHPFMDCNGRSGRALWAWRRKSIEGGFLLNFYFDQLKRK